MLYWSSEPLRTTDATRGEEDEEDGFYRTLETRLRTEQYMESQSSGSSEQALFQMLDYTDNNTVSNLSSDREFEKDPDTQKDYGFQAQLEPSAPYMPPSPDAEVVAPLSSSYENLYRGICTEPEVPLEPASAQDLDIGDRFDSRQTEPHLRSGGRTSSFEDLYAVGMPPEAAQAFAQEGESAGPAASSIFLLHDRVSSWILRSPFCRFVCLFCCVACLQSLTTMHVSSTAVGLPPGALTGQRPDHMPPFGPRPPAV